MAIYWLFLATLKTTVNVESRCDLKYLRVLVDEFLNKEVNIVLMKFNIKPSSYAFLVCTVSIRHYFPVTIVLSSVTSADNGRGEYSYIVFYIIDFFEIYCF